MHMKQKLAAGVVLAALAGGAQAQTDCDRQCLTAP